MRSSIAAALLVGVLGCGDPLTLPGFVGDPQAILDIRVPVEAVAPLQAGERLLMGPVWVLPKDVETYPATGYEVQNVSGTQAAYDLPLFRPPPKGVQRDGGALAFLGLYIKRGGGDHFDPATDDLIASAPEHAIVYLSGDMSAHLAALSQFVDFSGHSVSQGYSVMALEPAVAGSKIVGLGGPMQLVSNEPLRFEPLALAVISPTLASLLPLIGWVPEPQRDVVDPPDAMTASIGVGAEHACALAATGAIKCWGYNNDGQLGIGDTRSRGDDPDEMGENLPEVDLGVGRTALRLASGRSHLCALLDNLSIKCWGSNNDGQLGLGDTADRGDQVQEMGDALPPVALGSGLSPAALAAGGDHTCALFTTGAVKCWGTNDSGQLGVGDTVSRGQVPAQMGDGLPMVDLGAGRTAQGIAAGRKHSCALLDDGRVKCWGHNASGQLGIGDAANRGDEVDEMGDALPVVDLGSGRTAVEIAAFGEHTCARLDDGSAKCWGKNDFGQLGQGTETDIGDAPQEMGDALPPIVVQPGRTVAQLGTATGGLIDGATCMVMDDGSASCWGSFLFGQLGTSGTENIGDDPDEMGAALVPVALLPSGTTVRSIAMGADFTCCLDQASQVRCWGRGDRGQLGQGDTETIGYSLTAVPGISL